MLPVASMVIQRKQYTKIQKNREGQQMLFSIEKNGNILQININSATKYLINFMYSDKTSCNLAQARAKNGKRIKNK